MKLDRRIIAYVLYIILGAVLFGFSLVGVLDSFWSGMGGALIVVGIIRITNIVRYRKDEAYREEKEIEAKDERNRFIRNTAWAWAGYMFVVIAGIATIVLKVLGQDLLSQTVGITMCILVILYWLCYLALRKKY